MRRPAPHVAIVSTLIACAPLAHAADNWTNANGGSWSQTQFWSTGAVPGTGEDANINLPSFVDFSVVENVGYTPETAIGNFVVNVTRPVTLTFKLTDIHSDFYAANETIASTYRASVLHTGHTTNGISGSLVIGRDANAIGTYDMSGFALNAGVSEVIGSAGTGTFTQSLGTNTIGSDVAPGDLKLALLSGSYGTYTQTGGTLNVTGVDYIGLGGSALFEQNGGTHTSTQLFVGALNGANLGGTFDQTAGTYTTGTVQNYGAIRQAPGAGSFSATFINNFGGSFFAENAITITSGFYNSGFATLAGTQTWSAGTNFYNDGGTTIFKSDPNPIGGVTAATVTAGGVILDSIAHFKSLTITGTGKVTLPAILTPNASPLVRFLEVGTLDFDGPTASVPLGQLDLAVNNLIVDKIAPATFNSFVRRGYAAGAWTGAGVVSSSADVRHGIGFVPQGSGVFARLALYGDTDLDSTVGFADLLALAKAYGKTSTTWSTGDFNYDGTTDFADLLALAKNYGAPSTAGAVPANVSADWALAQSLVPEPAVACVIGAMLLHRRRRPIRP